MSADMDPGDCSTHLFPPDEVAPKQCPACGVTRPNLCEYDADLAHAIERPAQRPRGCLNQYDPRTSTFPF